MTIKIVGLVVPACVIVTAMKKPATGPARNHRLAPVRPLAPNKLVEVIGGTGDATKTPFDSVWHDDWLAPG